MAYNDQESAETRINEVAKELAELKAENEARSLEASLRVTHEQARKLLPLTASGLNPREALAIAKGRDPQAFGAVAAGGFDAGQHGSLRPTGGGPPAPPTMAQKIEEIRRMSNPIDRDAAERRLHGSLVLDKLAAMMGLSKRN
jgi:hypothetical protein